MQNVLVKGHIRTAGRLFIWSKQVDLLWCCLDGANIQTIDSTEYSACVVVHLLLHALHSSVPVRPFRKSRAVIGPNQREHPNELAVAIDGNVEPLCIAGIWEVGTTSKSLLA